MCGHVMNSPCAISSAGLSWFCSETMKRIPLTRGKFAIVDDEDFEWLSQWKWQYVEAANKRYGYARYTKWINGKKIAVNMHRVLMGAKAGQLVDHINRDTLDNRKTNLRFCTRSQNSANSAGHPLRASKFKGVTWSPRKKKWNAHIKNNYVCYHLGDFISEQEAACAYDSMAKKLFGEFAFLNLP